MSLEAMAAKQQHIVALPVPAQGHINPMLHWLRSLGSRGVLSTLLVPERDLARLSVNEPFIRAVGIPATIYDPMVIKNVGMQQMLLSILQLMEEAKDALVKFISSESFTSSNTSAKWSAPVVCLVVDLFINMGQDLANDLRVPRISFWTASAATLCINSMIPLMLSEGVLPSTEMDDLAIDFIPGITNLRRKNLPHSLFHPDLDWRVKTLSRNKEAVCVVGNTIYELEAKVIDAIEVVIGTKFEAIGPLFDIDKEMVARSPSGGAATMLWEEDMHCLGWLDKQVPSSVLYVSFGSLAQLTDLQVEQIALGLENCGQPFLWVVRPNLVQGLPENFFEHFSERTSDRGLVISWAPQLKVLGHKSVSGFFTHCGWNSSMEAVCCGVPMLGWPCFAEQNLNCKFIVDDWKIGLRFSKGKDGLVVAEEIERVVRLLMIENTGKELRDRCQGLAERVTKNAAEVKFDIHLYL